VRLWPTRSYSSAAVAAAAAAELTTESVVNSRLVVALNGYEWSDVACSTSTCMALSSAGAERTGLVAVIVMDTRRQRCSAPVLRILKPAAPMH